MSDAAAHRAPLARPVPWVVSLRAAQSLRREFARHSAHRVALVLSGLLVLFEWALRGPGAADVAGVLRDVIWCAALSQSATLGASRGVSDFDTLARMRGQPAGLHARALPLARTALAFSLHGGATLCLGLGLLFSRRTDGALSVLPSLAGLLLWSLVGALGLSALSWFSTRLLPRYAAIVFFACLVVPAALHSSLFELPSLVDAWARGIATCVGWLEG